MSHRSTSPRRADRFTYLGWRRDGSTVTAAYDTLGRRFEESVTFDASIDLERAGVAHLLDLWALVGGLSYYKAGAAYVIDLGDLSVSAGAHQLLVAALNQGLAEFAYRNDLDLSDVEVVGGAPIRDKVTLASSERVLIPFGGGIDSVVTTEALRAQHECALFVVSPSAGRFLPLEETAALSQLDVRRVSRQLDPHIMRPDEEFFRGHVPVTAMVTLLACIAAVGAGFGAVAMSNEHSASVPNLIIAEHDINHQWSKSWEAEVVLADAVGDGIGENFLVASALRDRSELWVAQRFAQLTQYHHTFRSCNRAFTHDPTRRAAQWCGTCDKCLFIALVLAPFLDRAALGAIFASEPLANEALADQLRALVGLGRTPFECVGDPDECRVALAAVAESQQWRDVTHVRDIAREAAPSESLEQHLKPRGVTRARTTWLR